jgi:nucleotide-binding universal stress UspA family protein
MKKILVPTDFSEASEKAVEYAIELANALKAKITFFKAYHPIPYAPEMYVYIGKDEIDELRKLAEDRMIELCVRVNKRVDVPCNYAIQEGDATDEILHVMNEQKPDLVIMGSHGASAISRMLYGSVTVQVARKTQYPLLVIPEKVTYSPFKKMVYATDYHDSDIEAIRFLAKLARKFDSEIDVLHVADGDIKQEFEASYFEELEKDVREKVQKKNLNFHLTEDKNIAHAIESFVKKEGADLVAVARLKRSFFLKVFLPSVTKKMIYHTDVPLLIFNAWDTPSDDF